MKYYLKFMLVAAICGSFVMIYYIFPDKIISSAELIDILGMVNIIDVPTYLSHITFLYGSMVFFEIFFGTYIYKHCNIGFPTILLLPIITAFLPSISIL